MDGALGDRIDPGTGWPRSGRPVLIEVYPGATLAAFYPKGHEVRTEQYKTSREARGRLLGQVLTRFQLQCDQTVHARLVGTTDSDADAMDAVIAGLTALVYLGRVPGWRARRPTIHEAADAAREGWIFFPELHRP